MVPTQSKQLDFFERVYDIVKQIPYGKVTTYGHIAFALGAKHSSRMVGWAMNAAHNRPEIPAHRVINRNGELTGKMHFATPTLMYDMLRSEGIEFLQKSSSECVDLSKHLWIPHEQD